MLVVGIVGFLAVLADQQFTDNVIDCDALL